MSTFSSSSANSAQWQPLRPTSIANAPHGGGREDHLDLARELEEVFSGSIFLRSEDDEAKARATNLCSVNEDGESSSLGEQETESEFLQSTRLYNAAAPLAAWMVVRPRNVQDVSAVVKFCADKGLSPSIKSGGFSTAGWAIQGDVVLDMRLMDGVVMLLPKTFQRRKRSKWSVDVAMDEVANGKEEISAKLKSSGGNIDFATVEGRLKAKARNVSSIDSRAHSREFAAGDASFVRKGLREMKRHRDEQDGEEMSRESCATPDSPRTRSAESGAEADTESGKSQTDVTMNSETSSPSQKESDEPEPARAGPANSSESPGQRSRATSSWIDRTLEESTGSGSGSQSGSNGAMSRSGTSNPTSGEAEADSDSKDLGMGGANQQQQQSLSPWTSDWDPNSTFEHERWQRHHCPPGSAVNRVQLPSSGGFVWTANDADASGQVTGGRISNTTEPVYRGGSTFNDLHSRNVSSSHLSSAASQSISDSNSNSLPPGIHKEQYALVEIGPGVGIRGLDTFSDRAGRLSIFDDDEEDNEGRSARKGKGKEEQDSLSVSEQGIDIVARGMPYHVPLSAYPVGSTALTIGGFGYLSRAYGLSLDNLVEIEIVLADGRIMVLNEASPEKSTEERDLWWAVRGAAPCFGVVTRLVAKAYPVPKVYAGSLIFPFNPITAPSLLRHWRDCLKGTGESVPRELYSNLILSAGPPSGARENVIVIQVCYLGTSSTDEVGNSFVQAICSWTGERVLLKDVTEKSFLDQQDGVAQVLKSGNRRRWMVRSDLVSTLTDESIYKTVEQFQQMGRNRAVWLFELIGGAIEDEKGTCISAQQRSAKFTVAALQQWLEVEEDERCVKAVDRWVSEVMSGISTGGPFPCFLEREESTARCEGSFGKDNFQRLVEIKKQVDPKGLFRHTFAKGLTTYRSS